MWKQFLGVGSGDMNFRGWHGKIFWIRWHKMLGVGYHFFGNELTNIFEGGVAKVFGDKLTNFF